MSVTQDRTSSKNRHGSARWRRSGCTFSSSTRSMLTILMVLSSLVSVVCATAIPLQDLAQRGRPYADLQPPRLVDRAAQATEATEATEEPSASTSIPTSIAIAAPSATATVLPQPFDTTLGNNFTTESCPRFFNNFLNDDTFKRCYPFSLLLQTSHGFFEAEKNFFQTTVALEASCSVDFRVCNNLMQSLASQLKSTSNCLNDFTAENQIVMQAYKGLIAYPVMYQAACLHDDHGDYCFANAITTRNNVSLADAYSYYLPLGNTMPVGNRPSCSDCLKKSMAVYRSYASNTTQPLHDTYTTAAQQVNVACGPDWVSDVVEASTSDATPFRSAYSLGVLLPLVVAALFVLC